MAKYEFHPAESRFTVQAFATGLLAALGHNPTFAIREFSGTLEFDPQAPASASLALSIVAASLALTDRVKPQDLDEIETTMRRDVLETEAHPRVTFRSTRIAADRIADTWHRVRIAGLLALHGVERSHEIEAQLRTSDGRARLNGETSLSLSDYGLKKVSALAGTIKLKDEVRFSFELVGRPNPA